jgi:excisionase family DNA binding protein
VSPTADNPSRRLLKVKQAATYMSISPWTVRKLVQSQQLRIVKLDDRGPWLLDVRDLDQFIETRKEYA